MVERLLPKQETRIRFPYPASKSMPKNGLRTRIEVSKNALKRNYNLFRNLIGEKCLLMAVVKSNAYGHGLLDFSKLMQKFGADWFGVDSIVEALALRKIGIKKPILVLGYTLPEKFNDAVKNKVSLTISTFEGLKNLNKNRVKFHLKIDTGMHRQGFLLSDMPKVVKFLKASGIPQKNLEGIYTHFAAAKNTAFPKDTLDQIKNFEKAAEVIEKAGFHPIKHASATSGAIIFPQARFDMVRIGIGLYGLWPSKEVCSAFENCLKLQPALSWKTIVGEIKNLPKASRIGYDFTETMQKSSRVAVCPVGYWHGYPRALSGIGKVLIKGKRARILGRISMDMIIIDVSLIPKVKVGDEVILMGQDNREKVSAEEIASLSDTVNYEILTRLNPLIKRIYF